MSDCIFCRIASGDIPAKILRQDDDTVVFHDLNPQAPAHVLVIPRRHIPTLLDVRPEDAALVAKVMQAAVAAARELGLDQSGFRIVTNTLESAGQSVFHWHVHLLGGRRMAWPPG